jgi:hypothetical protein
MENKMKKLIALFAVSAMASTSAMSAIALSGAASVSYDDNGSAASATTYDADLTVTGTAGTTTVTIGADVDGASFATSSATMATTIGPVTVTADMFDEVSADGDGANAVVTATAVASSVSGTAGEQIFESTDTSVTISIDAPIGDATVGVDDTGTLTVSGTWSGITMTSSTADKTTVAGSIAGMDVSVTNDDGATTWSLGTTVSGVALTLASSQKVTATFGLAGNTMVVSSIPAVTAAVQVDGNSGGTGTGGYGTRLTASAASYSTVAISRSLTSGATLAATYSTSDDSLTLKASVAF